MTTDNIQKQYNLSRKAASKLLKVSIRTLDRYVKQKKMSSQVISGRIWLNKGEIESFKDKKDRPATIDKVDMSTLEMSTHDDMDNGDNVDNFEQEFVQPVATKTKKGSEEITYQKLFLELKEDLKEKQERLEIANYRVGQLETQIRNSIPMLEYHRENFERKKIESGLKEKLEESEGIIEKLKIKIRYEKYKKKIFIAILLIILALQPLWLLIN